MKNNIDEIATGFESFVSFFSGLSMSEEKDANEQYEQYIQNYIRQTLISLSQQRDGELREVYREIKDAFKDQSEIGVNHLNVELEHLALTRGIDISDKN